ncbi:signal transduction histidine kinase [Weissella uvarum]|uniref:HAMP domain-containing sensor histidine kinase n=1 Tax=Weissella uvarum TaxID=1479233 RepID=UPI001960617A|nr:HAMP domain-containing histidine kinase [Weissella uvarum]MBM7617470.1 signal transduction histidine kinase [Weissella uvarum]MCM0595645.1 HAMP domain-containing protein [Weissella uvarum]
MEKDETTENSTATKRISLKWKWTLGTLVGVFFVFCMFAWFLTSAFSNRMLNNEEVNTRRSMFTVAKRLEQQSLQQLTTKDIDKILQPDQDDFSSMVKDPVVHEIARSDYDMVIYNEQGKQIYPSEQSQISLKRVKKPTVTVEKINGRKQMLGRQPITNQKGERVGYLVVENHLITYHKTFKQVYAIIVVSIVLGLMFLGLWVYWLSGYLLQPIKDMTKVADRIQKDPSSPERVSLRTKHPDELSELAAVFNEMLDKMQGFITQQQRFVEDVSHELRTPVAIVKGHMELLDRWGKDDPKILDESIQASLTEMKRMQGLVQEMLDLTRADQIELTFKDGQTDAKEVINAVYNNYKLIYPDFTFLLDDGLKGPTWLNMNRDHFEQILIILTDNAVKYSQDRKEIHFAASKSGSNLEVAIQDFGEGISSEDAKHIFDRFYRVDKARSRKQGGNGLGLSIAQKVIEGYGGEITLESAVGEGSVFRFTLPIQSETKA